MRYVRRAMVSALCAAVVLQTAQPVVAQQTNELEPAVSCAEPCVVTKHDDLVKVLQDYPVPGITPPNALIASGDYSVSRTVSKKVTYSVATRGATQTSRANFAAQVQAILNDERGWRRLGVDFIYAESGGDFTVILAPATVVPTFGAPCDATWNCKVGNYVVANEDRWLQATAPWNAAGGTVEVYRHLVINHELGHWLGHGHSSCGGAGQAAPVMQQQSMQLGGCKFNPWPLDSELRSSRLGI